MEKLIDIDFEKLQLCILDSICRKPCGLLSNSMGYNANPLEIKRHHNTDQGIMCGHIIKILPLGANL